MAFRIFQLGIVFAIGFYLGPAPLLAGVVNVTDITDDIPRIPLSIQLKDPKDVTVGKGQSATLRCEVTSTAPGLTISWLHNDKPIPNDTRRYVQEDGSLYFPKVMGGKKGNGITGEYKCLATNGHGSLLSSPARLRVASFDRDFRLQPSNQSVFESQPAVLFCDIRSIPAAQIEWEHNTVPLPHSTRYVPLPTGALLITKTQPSDAGSYRCIATNNLLKKTRHSKIVELTVSSGPMDTVAPTFLPLDILPNTTVLFGDNVTLYCAVTGWPIPTVQWLNNNSIVISNSSILTLHNVNLDDAGSYTCIAYNSGGRRFQKFSVAVHQKPYFQVTPISKAFPSARTVRLDCQAKGVPEPKIYWLKNGSAIPMEGRINNKQMTGLVFSHTFSYDSGIYQCVAVNAAGRVWTAAQLTLSISDTPSPPENVQCRSFDDTSICLTWRSPENVSAQAYSIYSFYSAMGPEISGPEFVTNVSRHLATGLNPSTNYTFYVRLYLKIASDQSKKVTCQTGLRGSRDLKITALNETSVELTWSEVSTDIPCGKESRPRYKVQWKRKGPFSVNSVSTEEFSHVITGLHASLKYDIRVSSALYKVDNSPWATFENGESSVQNKFHYESGNATDLIAIPEHLQAHPISATVVNLSWADIGEDTKYYVVCYSVVDKFEGESDCEETNLIKSTSNVIQIDKLRPNTMYEFKVRSHNSEGYFSPFSQPVETHTPLDAPSPITNLDFRVVNDTTACLSWQVTQNKSGKITKFLISYTPDTSWHLHQWINKTVPGTQNKFTGCWPDDDGKAFSTLLVNLKPDKTYTVLIRADSETEPGKLITLGTGVLEETNLGAPGDGTGTDTSDNKAMYNGIFGGVTVAIILIVICVACICARRHCLKRQNRAQSRMAASNDYHPAVARYASEGAQVQVRVENRCAAEVHEIEHLVSDDHPAHIPAITPTHLDTKGGDGFPNGHINGSAKPCLNGHLMNGDVHITENPRYYAHECNGHVGGRNPRLRNGFCPQYEEDSNSNLKTSKFQDLHRLFENSKKQRAPPDLTGSGGGVAKSKYQCSPHLFTKPGFRPTTDGTATTTAATTDHAGPEELDSSHSSLNEDEYLMNATQMTCLDSSVIGGATNHHRRVSPILGPNG